MIGAPEWNDIRIADGDVIFLCEGKDETFVIKELTKTWTKTVKIGTRNEYKGQSMLSELRAMLGEAKLRQFNELKIGIVVDAESDYFEQEAKLKRWFKQSNLTVPGKALEVTITEFPLDSGLTTKITLCYLINPHDKPTGQIEDLFFSQIELSPACECIEQFVNCIKSQRDISSYEKKLKLRVYIASHTGTNTNIATGLQKRCLSCDTEDFDPVKVFVQSLA